MPSKPKPSTTSISTSSPSTTSKTVIHPKVEAFLAKAKAWREEFTALREIAASSGLTEDLKWGCPCYTLDGKNVLLIHGFKEYCALLFFKGALMQDSKGLLIQQTENVQSARQIRFKNAKEITSITKDIAAYIVEAKRVEESGAKVERSESHTLSFPEEFQSRLDSDAKLRKAFAALTPGRQRAYNLYFTSAKQSQTRAARVEKCLPQILAGKGLDD